MNKICPKCSTAVPEASAFCTQCGASLAPGTTVDLERLRKLYNHAVSLGPPWHEAWIHEACEGDATMASELSRLLAARSAVLQQSGSVPGGSAPAMPPGASAGDSAYQPAGNDPSSAPYSPPAPVSASSAPYQAPPVVSPAGEPLIGAYRLLRELGRGGMGVVYLAVRDDGTFRKNVALKVLIREQANDEFIQRFKQERQVLAALDHPNIARILDGGDTPDGTPYYVMEYVEGVPVDGYCDQHRLSLTARIKVFQQVCKAVNYLHQNSILHRDLKPSNILVSGDDVVKLLDFGIAKMTGAAAFSNPDLTSAQGRPMTPTYASPEQFAGGTLKSTSDIYSLGVILYRLLTGRLPYEGLDDKIAKLASREAPPLPSANIREDLRVKPESTAQLRRAMLGDIDAIILKAMQYDPKDRYESAGELADDLQRFLEGQEVTAHQSSMARKSVRLVKRKRALLAVLAGFALLAAFGIWQWLRVGAQKAEVAAREGQIRSLLDQLETRLTARATADPNAAIPVADQIQDIQKLKQAFATDYTAAAARRPGQSPERVALLERGVRYLDHVQAAVPAQAGLGLELADGYQQLGVLREKTTGSDAASRGAALQTYQKAATVLVVTATANPTDAQAQERLRAVNQRIAALGGAAITSTPEPPPQPTPAPPAPEPPPSVTPTPKSKPAVVTPPPPPVTTPPPERPQPPPAVVPPPAPGISAADQAELDDRMISVSSKAQVAEQAIEPYRQNLARNGQTLTADILNSQAGMRAALDRAKRQLAAGNAAAAKESLAAAEAYATRLLRAVGR